MRKLLATVAAASFLTGCAYVDYKPYEGANHVIPGGQGTFVDRAYGLPIYSGIPPYPFVVIGKINASDRMMSMEGTDHAAVRVAKAHGADAVINIGKSQVYGGSQGGFTAQPLYSTPGVVGSTWSSARWLENADYVAIRFVK